MKSSVAGNDNWGTCPKCGEPVMIDPKTGEAEPCATCVSAASKTNVTMGVTLLIAGIVLVASLVYLCLRILL